jgi:hypothetical protein
MNIVLNLIPSYRKEQIERSRRLRLVAKLEIAIVIIGLAFFSFLFACSYILELNYGALVNGYQAGSDKKRYEKISELDKKFSDTNFQAADVVSIKKDQLYWANLFVKINADMVNGIGITDLSTKNYAVFLAGNADNRDQLIAFKEKLTQDECLTGVNLPLSNLVDKENIGFQIDFKIKAECLKNK